jgi:hypothetical protein
MKFNTLSQKITTAFFIATVVLSCEPRTKTPVEPATATPEEKSQQNISYGDLIIKEQSDYLMIPVMLTEQEPDKLNQYGLSRSYGKEKKLNNFIFYHKQDGINHLLLNKKAIINSFDFLEVKSADKPPTRYWLYRIIEQDTNADKKLNFQDAIVGYISDLSGKNLVQITPNNTQMVNWVVIPSQNALFIKINKDSDNDKKFTEQDQSNFIRVSLDKPGMGTEIISNSLEQKIKADFSK